MATNPWEEGQFEALNDLESARLALRGALATIRDLQDLNLRLKGNLQEAAAREKLVQQEISQIQQHLKDLENRNRICQEEHQSAHGSAELRDRIRQQIIEEERTKIAEDHKRTEEDLARLQSVVEGLRQMNQQKEREWLDLKRILEFREAEILSAQREKVQVINRYREESALFGDMRAKKDEEFRTVLRAHELELERKNRDIHDLQKKNREMAESLASGTRELDRRLQKTEQDLLQEHQQRQQSLQEMYNKRQAEIEASWTQMEHGLWQRSRETQEKLDRAAQEQFEQHTQMLADRKREIEALLERRRAELEGEFQKKLQDLQAQFQDKERLSLERARQMLEAEFMQKEHEAQMQWVAKEQALEKQLQGRQKELHESWLKRGQDLQEEWNLRNVELLQEQEKAVEAEKSVLKTRIEQEAQEQLNREIQKQLEASSEVLAQRKGELETAFETRRKELETEFQVRIKELEAQFQDSERISLERTKQKLEVDFAQKEQQSQVILRAKIQALEAGHHARQMDLQDAWVKKENGLQEEWNQRKTQLLAEQEKAVQSEKSVLRAQIEQEARRLDESYRGRVAELERMQQSSEEQFRTWKATVIDEYMQKEKNLDKQWFIREQELVRKYEIAMEQERRTTQFENARTREQFEQMRKRNEEEYFKRAELLKEKFEASLKERETAWTQQETDIHARHQSDMAELRVQQRLFLAQQAKHFENEMVRIEEGWKVSTEQLREKHQTEILDMERQLLETQLSVKNLKDRISKMEAEDASRRAGFEADEARIEAEFIEREKDLEARIRQREEALKREREKLYEEFKHKEEVLRQAIYREHSEAMEAELRVKEGEWIAREQATAQTAGMKEERLKTQYEKREELLKSEWAHREADLVAEYELRLEKEKRRLADIELAMADRLKQRTQELEREARGTLAQKEAMLLHRHQEALARERSKLEAEFAERAKVLERKKRERETD